MNNEDFENEPIHQPAPENPPQPEGVPPSAPAPVPAPQKQQTVRRVGTLTMGFALIATGIIALIATFLPQFDLLTVLKLSPILFIFLGVEILINYFFHKHDKIKYDFFSNFVCFLLICGGLGLSVIPTIWSYCGPPAEQAREEIQDEIEDTIYTKLGQDSSINAIHLNTHLPYTIKFDEKTDRSAYIQESDVYARFELAGPYADKEAFAADCQRILSKIKDVPYRIQSINFTFDDGKHSLQLYLEDKFQLNMDAASLSRLVSQEIYYNESSEEAEMSSAEESSEEAPDAESAPVEEETPLDVSASTAVA